MTKGQRIVVLVGLLVAAGLLHTMLCEWRYRLPSVSGRMPDFAILAVNHGTSQVRNLPAYTGLFAQPSNERSVAVVFGVVTPLLIICLEFYLLLGWRHQSRLARGRCPQCNYDLCGDSETPGDVCPECGWRRSS